MGSSQTIVFIMAEKKIPDKKGKPFTGEPLEPFLVREREEEMDGFFCKIQMKFFFAHDHGKLITRCNHSLIVLHRILLSQSVELAVFSLILFYVGMIRMGRTQLC